MNKNLLRKFLLPSGKIVQIRRETRDDPLEYAVRDVADDGKLSLHEYNLSLKFLETHGVEVKNA